MQGTEVMEEAEAVVGKPRQRTSEEGLVPALVANAELEETRSVVVEAISTSTTTWVTRSTTSSSPSTTRDEEEASIAIRSRCNTEVKTLQTATRSHRAHRGEGRTASSEEASQAKEAAVGTVSVATRIQGAAWATSKCRAHQDTIREAAIMVEAEAGVGVATAEVATIREVQTLNAATELGRTQATLADTGRTTMRRTVTSPRSTFKMRGLGKVEEHTKVASCHLPIRRIEEVVVDRRTNLRK